MPRINILEARFEIGEIKTAREKLKSPRIVEVARQFGNNIASARCLIEWVVAMTTIIVQYETATVAALHNRLKGRISMTAEEMEDEKLEQEIRAEIERITDDWHEMADNKHKDVFAEEKRIQNNIGFFMERYCNHSDASQMVTVGIGRTFQSMIVGLWTAFEVMASDLWLTCLNFGPKSLAKATLGAVKRGEGLIDGYTDQNPKEARKQEASIPWNFIDDEGYDLREKMGTILKKSKRVQFDSLASSIKAYKAAFGSTVDSLFDFHQPDAANLVVLEAVRNVVVHTGGVVDEDFERKIAKAAGSPLKDITCLKDGDELPVSADLVRDLAGSVIRSALALLDFADAAITLKGDDSADSKITTT